MTTSDCHYLMRAVGVRELKAKLSEYLRLVRGGDVELSTADRRLADAAGTT